MVSDVPAGDGKTGKTFFLQCRGFMTVVFLVAISANYPPLKTSPHTATPPSVQKHPVPIITLGTDTPHRHTSTHITKYPRYRHTRTSLHLHHTPSVYDTPHTSSHTYPSVWEHPVPPAHRQNHSLQIHPIPPHTPPLTLTTHTISPSHILVQIREKTSPLAHHHAHSVQTHPLHSFN